jgi:DNA-binding response OmpR family regulator
VRILMVDDSEDSRDVTEAALLSAGYDNIVTAASGRETLKFLDVGRTDNDAAPVDIMLLDIVMPEMDGIEVCAHVRNDARYADLPIIMVTSVDDVSSLANALVAGANDYVAKPVNPAELTTRMRVALRRKQDLDGLKARQPGSPVAANSGTLATNKAGNGSERSRSIEVITPAEKNKFRARLRNERTKLMALQARLGSPASSQESQDVEELQVVVHKLAGAAGIFGFHAVSQAATQLEELIIDTKSGNGGAEKIVGDLAGLLGVIEPECKALEESQGN